MRVTRLGVSGLALALALAFVSAIPSRTIEPSTNDDVYPERIFRQVPTPSPTPTQTPPRPTPKATATIAPEPARAIRRGVASTYGPGYPNLLALPEGRGIRVRICGQGGCIVRVSNDAGPSKAMQRKGRIVDLNIADFERVCGCSWRKGLTKVTVEYL